MLKWVARACDWVAGVLWLPALSFLLTLLWIACLPDRMRVGLIDLVLPELVQIAVVPAWVWINRRRPLLRALAIGSVTHVAAVVAEHIALLTTSRNGVDGVRYFEFYRLESGAAAVLCVTAGMTILLVLRDKAKAGTDAPGTGPRWIRRVGAWVIIIAAIATAATITRSLIERGGREADRWAVAAGGTLMDSQGRLLDKDRVGAGFIVGAPPNMRLGEAMGWVFRTNELPGYTFLVMDRPRNWEGPGPDVQVILGLADSYTMRGSFTEPTILADLSGVAADAVWREGPTPALCKRMVDAYLAGAGTPAINWVPAAP